MFEHPPPAPAKQINASTLLAQWQALARLGLDMEALRVQVGPLPGDPGERVAVERYLKLWAAAQAQYAQPCLPTALAMAVPFGAFGIVDYLAASAATLGGGCESLALHARIVAEDTSVEISRAGTLVWLTIRCEDHVPPQAQEFALAMLASRLRFLVDPELRFAHTHLSGQPDERGNGPHAALFGAPVRYGAPCAALAVFEGDWLRPIKRADAYLHAMLHNMARQLMLAAHPRDDLELAVRVRLRDLLPRGDATPQGLARLLGLSERTLQRRLAVGGRSFSRVLEDFQHEESLRLLGSTRLGVAQVAQRVGYAEQSSFTRAFKRWTGTTPAAWRERS